jgi:hypothetical protein
LFPALLQFLRRRSGATHAHSSGRIRFETARETIPIHNLPLVLVHTVDFSEILHQLIDGLSHYYIIYRVSTIQGGAWFLPSKKNMILTNLNGNKATLA